jgi:phosphoribosylformimino-5-aminoimidazole carboxamide ribotide isomerase
MKAFPDLDQPWIFPAIDLRGGRCVRLVRGARDAEIHYDDDAVRVARRWCAAGARCLHVIDLGSAFGEADSMSSVLEIASAVPVPIQMGGGIRDADKLAKILDGGVARVILGTKAFRDPPFLEDAVRRFSPARIMVSMDLEGDTLKIGGWEESSALGLEEAVRRVEGAGVSRLLVTATDRDGTLSGPRVDLIRSALEASRSRIVAAGGIGSLEHVRSVLEIRHPRLDGVVVGRALYEGKVDLAEALKCAATRGLAGTSS